MLTILNRNKHLKTISMKTIIRLKTSVLLIALTGMMQGQINPDITLFGEKVQASSIDPVNSVIRCGTTEYESYLRKTDKNRASEEEFEAWLAPEVEKTQARMASGRISADPIIIPVVVHIIESTMPGLGPNISDARVESQITVLNQDYRRMFGTPGYNTDPVGADIGIEFRLAKVDPNGNPTNGINRVKLNGTWTGTTFETVKPGTQWDPNRYFNIWVCEFGEAASDLLGYAQFPQNSGLGGMEEPPFTANTDGVVISWKAFGSQALVNEGAYLSPYNGGRTLTHEIGHALGLRHVWGDNSSCVYNAQDTTKDYCPDTPPTNTSYGGCQVTAMSCKAGTYAMVRNYMDYSNDACLNIFTQNQKARILTVLQKSPRRLSLTTSNVWLSVDEAKASPETVSLYPNPVRNELNVKLGNSGEYATGYTIYDLKIIHI